jgi:hypothetical protein
MQHTSYFDYLDIKERKKYIEKQNKSVCPDVHNLRTQTFFGANLQNFHFWTSELRILKSRTNWFTLMFII